MKKIKKIDFKISEVNKKRLENIKVFALDLDGTIYLGNKLFPFSIDFLNGIKKAGKDFIFLTNNSSKNANDYYCKLSSMGIELTPNQIYTTNMATIEYLNKKKPGARIFLIGTKNLQKDWRIFRGGGLVRPRTGPRTDPLP